MLRSKFFSGIKKLSVYEVNDFSDLVNSPYFNKNKHILRLWDIFFKAIKEDDLEEFSREAVYAQLFDDDYDELKLNNLLSDLNQLLEQYLLQLQLKEEKEMQEQLLLRQLNQRQLNKHFRQSERRLTQFFDNAGEDPEQLHKKYIYHHIADDHYMRQSKKIKKSHLQQKMDQLDRYYMISKLKTACEMLNRQRIINVNYKMEMLDEVMAYIEAGKRKNDPLLKAYLKIYHSFIAPDDEIHFKELTALLQVPGQHIKGAELREIYDYAQNYCIRKINAGRSEYLAELFKIYQQLLERGLMIQDGYLSEWDYKNITTVAIRLKEYSWTAGFLEGYKKKLPPASAENAYIYNLSTLYFAEKKYTKAIELLRDVEFSDVVYHLGAKTTLLKIYFEEQEEEAFRNLTDTFKIYLHRNKMISTPQKQAYKNMLSLAQKIFKLQVNRNYYSITQYRQQHKKIEEKLKSVRNIANINWVKEILPTLMTEGSENGPH